MAYAVELYFDDTTDAAIRAIWHDLAQQRVAPFLADTDSRPHLTLAIYERLSTGSLAEPLATFAATQPLFRCSFAALGLFLPGPQSPTAEPVIYCGPVVTSELLELHRRVHDLLRDWGEEPWAHYLPERWVPHCSLAVHFAHCVVPDALAICQQLVLPREGTVVGIGAVATHPVSALCAYPLTG